MGKLYIRSARIENKKGYLPEVMITLTDILFVFSSFSTFFFLFTPIYADLSHFSLTRPAAWDTIIYGKNNTTTSFR